MPFLKFKENINNLAEQSENLYVVCENVVSEDEHDFVLSLSGEKGTILISKTAYRQLICFVDKYEKMQGIGIVIPDKTPF